MDHIPPQSITALVILFATIHLMSCAETRDDSETPKADMQIELELDQTRVKDSADLKITAQLTNTSRQSLHLNTLFLGMPSLVFQVVDATSKRIALAPPPVPPVDDGTSGRQTLAAGESISFYYSGNSLFGVPLSTGAYSIRYFFEMTGSDATQDWEGVLQSTWLEFFVEESGI